MINQLKVMMLAAVAGGVGMTGVVSAEESSERKKRLAQRVAEQKNFFVLLDKDKDEKVSFEEFWGVWGFAYSKKDKDGDGMVKEREYFTSATEMTSAQFKKLDTNGDGSINTAEEKAYRTKHFNVTDLDGDGFITVDEMLEVQNLMDRAEINKRRAARAKKKAEVEN